MCGHVRTCDGTWGHVRTGGDMWGEWGGWELFCHSQPDCYICSPLHLTQNVTGNKNVLHFENIALDHCHCHCPMARWDIQRQNCVKINSITPLSAQNHHSTSEEFEPNSHRFCHGVNHLWLESSNYCTSFCGEWNLARTPQTNLKFHEAERCFCKNFFIWTQFLSFFCIRISLERSLELETFGLEISVKKSRNRSQTTLV